jgi:Ca2+-binding RTX toxin-like protein
VSFWRALETSPDSSGVLNDPGEGGPAGMPVEGKKAQVTVHDWFNGLRTATGLTLTGTATNTNLAGGWNNDILISGPGNDTIDGGAGTDTAVFSGTRANYTATLQGDGSIKIVDNRAGSPNGTDIVSNVERFQFSDKTVTASDLLGTPDLVANSVSLGSSTVAAGGSTTISYHIQSIGSVAASPYPRFIFRTSTTSRPRTHCWPR